MAWVGLDIGAKRTGVAISESGQLTAPLGVLRGSFSEQLDQLLKLLAGQEVQTIVVGQPVVRDEPHPVTEFTQLLIATADQILGKPTIQFVNETLTSKEAERLLRMSGRPQTDSDVVAAQLILEQFFTEEEGMHAK